MGGLMIHHSLGSQIQGFPELLYQVGLSIAIGGVKNGNTYNSPSI
jgi:hypothetical protein